MKKTLFLAMGLLFFSVNLHSQVLSNVIQCTNILDSEIRGMKIDDVGNVYIAGCFDGILELNGSVPNLISNGDVDGFVAKFNAVGSCLWAHNIGTINRDKINDLAIDEYSNVYVCGYFDGSGSFNDEDKFGGFGGGTSRIIKYDNSGNLIWEKSFSGGNSNPISITYKLNELVIVGFFAGTVDFDPGTGINNYNTSNNSDNDAFIAKANSSDGAISWVKQIGLSGPGVDYAVDAAIDVNGRIYIVGNYKGIVDFDPGTAIFPLSSNGGIDIFHLCLNSLGEFIWANSVGGNGGNDRVSAITLDNNNNLIIVGKMAGDIDINPNSGIYNLFLSNGSYFVLKLSSSGSFIWGRNLNAAIYDVTSDNADNIYYTGTFLGSTDFDLLGGTFTLNSIPKNFFLSKINSNGNLDWVSVSSSFDPSDLVIGTCISNENNGKICAGGYFVGTGNFANYINSPLFSTSGSKDALIYCYSSGATTTNLNTIDENAILFYPNPTKSNLTIEYSNFLLMNGYTLTILNTIGQTVFTTPINQQTSYIDLSTWTGSGIYYVQLIDPQNNTIENRKIVIQ